MKKLAYAILIFFFLKILFTLFSGDFLKIITGFQFGFLIGDPILIGSIIPLFTGCFPAWDVWSCNSAEPYLSLILFLGIFLSTYLLTRLTIFIKNKEKIVKIVNYTLLTFGLLTIGYSIFLLRSMSSTNVQNCEALPFENEEDLRDCYLMKILEKPLDEIKKTDSEYCEKSSNQNLCYETIAKKLNDPSICHNIKIESERNCCSLLEKTKLAAEEKDDKICDDLRDTYEKNKNNTMDLCYKLYDYVNLCYQKVAIAKNDENYCERISFDYIGINHYEILLECYSVIAKNKNDSKICGKMAGKKYMDDRIPLCIKYVNK